MLRKLMILVVALLVALVVVAALPRSADAVSPSYVTNGASLYDFANQSPLGCTDTGSACSVNSDCGNASCNAPRTIPSQVQPPVGACFADNQCSDGLICQCRPDGNGGCNWSQAGVCTQVP